ncbi:hypothetical protein RUM44_011741 [Polyplax serrata]|uniref:Dystroglycan 1 n=1 Tax=Polyplax serrata TaxID=468196 RepID=A0ABR1AQY2_POLSC
MDWKKSVLFTISISLYLASVKCQQDDEFIFDELPLEVDTKISHIVPVQRLWGIPDTQAIVGKLFVLNVPNDAFKGDIDYYEVGVKNNGRHQDWPKWLNFDKRGVLKGVPVPSDVGIYYISITAVAPSAHYKSKDVFAIDVIQPGLDAKLPEEFLKNDCPESLDPIMLTVLMDVRLQDINPQNRISILENIAGYLSLNQEQFYLHEEKSSKDVWFSSESFYFLEGPGHGNKASRTELTSISFQIGCGRKVENRLKSLIGKIKVEALDGTLSEVLLYPVVGWYAKNELPLYYRGRRQVGSGDQYEDEDDEEEDYIEPITTTSNPHPHRHHHGEDFDMINETKIETVLSPSEIQYHLPSTSLLIDYDEDLISTPLFVPDRPTEKVSVEPTKVFDRDYFSATASTIPNIIYEDKTDRSRPQKVTIPYVYGSDGDNVSDSTSDFFTMSNFTDQSPTEYLPTDSLKLLNISIKLNTSTTATTEEMEPRNFRPTIAHRLKKVAATAGKVLRFKIPENTFADVEDGTTSHMTLNFKSQEGKPISPNSWIKFDTVNQEIMAIPLEEHVSKWEFEVEATDKDGDSVSDIFSLQIQHHKGHRAVNFEFSAELVPSSNWTTSFDWQERIVNALVNVYGDPDSSQITVRSLLQHHLPYIFSWTNDSLPRSYCPRNDIDNLYKVIADDDGDVTEVFRKSLGKGISIKKIKVVGIGQCESKSSTPTPQPPQSPHTNFSPVPRNQIDQVNATAGCLLVFKVPEDTCYDPEDGSTRKLKVSLLNMDRTHLDPNQWLQFDSKNQEFYGVPMDSDVKSQEYQLVCQDREGLTANDGLIVVVSPRQKQLYSVEFTIAIDVLYDSFVSSSSMKRKFIEKLRDLFHDSNTDAIVLGNISEGSTIITWYNRTLPTHVCPTEEIHKLREILINDDESMNERLVSIMGYEFPVISVGLEPAGSCQGELTVLHKPESPPPPIEDNFFPIGVTEDYLFTYVIPAVLIALMLILAGIIACLFYRKRRASKMGIGDNDDKQSFRNKGIPVIFQDELEDKPEAENKCPVIMKDEKPPLPPPEYQRSHHNISVQELNDDAPYQPPPPFTSSKESSRNSRPKPTPTYRKPPPYVPP